MTSIKELDDRKEFLAGCIHDGLEAKRVFNEPMLQQYIKAVEDAATSMFEVSAIDDDRLRLEARLTKKIVDELKRHFKLKINGGYMAQQELDEITAGG